MLAGAAVGQSIPTADVRGEGAPRFDPTQIVFKPGAGHVGLTLSVSGPEGYQLKQDYEPGVNPTFSVRDLSDGLYNYELRIAKALSTPDETESSATTRAGVPSNERGMRQSTKQPQDTIVQSGHFQIEAGSLVLRDLVERGGRAHLPEFDTTDQTGLATKDICHNDDLIVDGSLCVGFDCTCNYSFGFDTIVLKENNLRIFFDDTSTAASFPRNDWRIVINDSANGGASYFGIEDSTSGRRAFTVEAGAPSHSLYVEDGGRVDFGTSTPTAELHTKDGDTPTLRLEQDGSSGFAPQTWDVAGNETNFFIRDVTHGSSLPFRIRPGAPTSSIDIAASGNVGFGTASPGASLHINETTGGAGELLRLTNNGGLFMTFANTSASNWYLVHEHNAPNRFLIGSDAVGQAFALTTDGNLTIAGELVTGTSGSCTDVSPCDGVFSPDYEVSSIEEQGAYMWENSHLPAVGPTEAGEPINVTQKMTAILHELEKAHIYIEQLNNRLKAGEKELAEIRALLAGRE